MIRRSELAAIRIIGLCTAALIILCTFLEVRVSKLEGAVASLSQRPYTLEAHYNPVYQKVYRGLDGVESTVDADVDAWTGNDK